ncbi:MAG: OmpH family outer membrane protein, partial [Fibrobacterales bacterium]|nr:OmpH family outer membrane protein [Fibrobacterales bacterium]
ALWEQEANVKQREVDHLRERIEQQSLMLSMEKRKELEAELELKETELREFVDRIYGENGELVKENAKISAPIIKEIRRAVNEVALQEGYDMVLDRSSGAVLFWKNENDLTDRVVEVLNGGK